MVRRTRPSRADPPRSEADATNTQTDAQAAAPAGTPAGLTPEAVQFAHRMFNAARTGDEVLLQALDAGLPVDLTNDEGTRR